MTEPQHRKIYMGDVMDQLSLLPDNSIDCIISSPPYWALRDYAVDGQWGSEKTLEEYLSKMKLFMDQLKRILKNTGTCWINLGDTYSTGIAGITEKSRVGMPERFYCNCIDSGWIARNVITWIKFNAMPQSIKDRFANKWEYVYFFAKDKKYYFNLNAVRIEAQTDSKSFNIRVRDNKNGKAQQKLGERAWTATEEEMKRYNKDGTKKIVEKYTDKDSNVSRLHKNRSGNPNNKQDETLGADGKPKLNYVGFNDRWNESDNNKGKNPGDLTFEKYTDEEILEWIKLCRDNSNAWHLCPPDLFCINPKRLPEAHFATFPVNLPKRILKATCPKETCVKCGVPRFPISKPTEQYQKVLDSVKKWGKGGLERGLSGYKDNLTSCNAQYEITGYETCECNDEFIPGIVLDPFFGAGTTGIAAEQLGLRWCGIEIKEGYSTIARKRLAKYVEQECLI